MQILNTLKSIKSETNLSLVTKTVVKLLKKDKEGNKNEFGVIYKIAKSDVVVGKDYQQSVNDQRIVEGKVDDFIASERKWGDNEGIFVTKGDQLYLNTILIGTKTIQYVNENGVVVDKNQFKQFVSTPTSASRQQLDDEIKVRTFKIDSIVDVIVK